MPFSPAMAIYCARDEVHIYRLKDSNWAGGSNMLAQYLIHSTARNSKCTRALETHGHIQGRCGGGMPFFNDSLIEP